MYQCQVIMDRYGFLRIVVWPPRIRDCISDRQSWTDMDSYILGSGHHGLGILSVPGNHGHIYRLLRIGKPHKSDLVPGSTMFTLAIRGNHGQIWIV